MFEIFNLKTFTDDKGSLTPIELKDYLDFEVKRVYLVHNSGGKNRGAHAHFNEKEFFFLASGSCLARIHDGEKWIEHNMEAAQTAIYVGNNIWHEFTNFSEDASLVALSSTNYNPNRSDYEEDFKTFVASHKVNKDNFSTNV